MLTQRLCWELTTAVGDGDYAAETHTPHSPVRPENTAWPTSAIPAQAVRCPLAWYAVGPVRQPARPLAEGFLDEALLHDTFATGLRVVLRAARRCPLRGRKGS